MTDQQKQPSKTVQTTLVDYIHSNADFLIARIKLGSTSKSQEYLNYAKSVHIDIRGFNSIDHHLRYIVKTTDWPNCDFITIGEAYNIIMNNTRGNGLVAEAWEFELASNLHFLTKYLNEDQADALLTYTGYKNVNMQAMGDYAAECVADARRNMYGY